MPGDGDETWNRPLRVDADEVEKKGSSLMLKSSVKVELVSQVVITKDVPRFLSYVNRIVGNVADDPSVYVKLKVFVEIVFAV